MHERKVQGRTVSEVASKIRIRERIIRALESDDTDEIAPIYLRGYIRTYALELGLDPDQFSTGSATKETEDSGLQAVFEIDPKRSFSERWLKSGSYLVATALIAALVWQVTQQAVEFSQGTTSFAGKPVAEPDPEASIANSASPNATASRGTHLAASIASLEKLRTPPSVDSGSAAEHAWSAITSPTEDAPLIHISVSADSWVEIIDSNGEMIEKDLLRGGNQRSYAGSPPFELLLGRPAAVVVEFNGEPVDLTPHISGDVARLTLGAAEQPNP